MKLCLCVNTQTPLVRFKVSYEELLERYGGLEEPIKLEKLVEGHDYYYSPGGVTAMLYPMLRELIKEEIVSSVRWVSLNHNAPPEVIDKEICFYHVQLPSALISRYASFKEGIWKEFHGLGHSEFRINDYAAYATYNWLTAQMILKFILNVDLLWVHDFQQLQVGSMVGPSVPSVFQWHIPFKPELLSEKMRKFVLRNMECYDAVVVSTRRALEGLIEAGFRGRAYQIYPYIDPRKWAAPPRAEMQRVLDRYGIRDEDYVALIVARMDSIKGQDTAIRAVALARKRHPNLKLLLVGDGSFTSTGLGYGKGNYWARTLQNLARELKVIEYVHLLGYVPDEELRSLYARADAVLLPSLMEGFGLTVIEAWNYKKPVIVSRGAGVSELIVEGVNGLIHEPGDHKDLYEKLCYLLENPEEAEKMGATGCELAQQCFVSSAVERTKELFEAVIESSPREVV
ncbi:MAG: glycosyltransferase family 4 protein [Candidatus Verstraetearchaeota archaeon]|nr:glycosyltransferase family 4 protein [Candidatus Verstraetearchaeota archaeon]